MQEMHVHVVPWCEHMQDTLIGDPECTGEPLREIQSGHAVDPRQRNPIHQEGQNKSELFQWAVTILSKEKQQVGVAPQ